MCNEKPMDKIEPLMEFIEKRADRIYEREAKKEIAKIEAPVELVKGVLTFAVLVAFVLCVGVPLVLLLFAHVNGWFQWQVVLAYITICAGIGVVLAVVIVVLIRMSKDANSSLHASPKNVATGKQQATDTKGTIDQPPPPK